MHEKRPIPALCPRIGRTMTGATAGRAGKGENLRAAEIGPHKHAGVARALPLPDERTDRGEPRRQRTLAAGA